MRQFYSTIVDSSDLYATYGKVVDANSVDIVSGEIITSEIIIKLNDIYNVILNDIYDKFTITSIDSTKCGLYITMIYNDHAIYIDIDSDSIIFNCGESRCRYDHYDNDDICCSFTEYSPEYFLKLIMEYTS
jgi:hypothetical protein